jgi:tetratricopeptide (TPR) repeat protein
MPPTVVLKAWFVVVLALLLSPQSARCQRSDRPVQKSTQQTKKPAEDRTHWKFLLDSLIVETRLIDPEEERPLVIAELADAYWLIDQQQAKKLFIESFDTALAMKENQPVAPVLSRVAKRDRALATELTKRLLAIATAETDSREKSVSTARELLKADPGFAIELAKLSAALGPSMDGLWLLFKVVESDPASAAEIYGAYLKSLGRGGYSDLGSVLWLGGYPFGYGEAYGGSNDPASLHGFWGMRVRGLQPQPNLATTYLQIAFVAITNTLKKAAQAEIPDKDALNALALYATSYLFPEVQRYLPDAEGAWSNLYRQALAGTPEQRRADIEQRLSSIREVRARTSEQSNVEYARNEAKEKLAEIEKLSDTCSRDRAYAQVALAHSYAKDFTEARQVADRIDRLELRDSVLQYTYFDEVVALLDRGDLVRAVEWIEKVAAKEQRAVLYVRIAGAALKKSDKAMVLDALNRARSLVRDADDAAFQAGVLLSVGATFAKFDASEATYAMRDSIRAINRIKEPLDESFSIMRQVSLNCAVGEIRWHGGRERVETFNFYETLAEIAKSDAQAEGALALASEIQDRAKRIRAQLSIVKAVIK